MEYKKIINDNYTIHFINTNRFKTVSIVIFLTKEFNKDDIPYGKLLTQNLLYTSKKYNTKDKMAGVVEDLYGTKVSIFYGMTGQCNSYAMSLDLLNPKYIDKKYLKKCIKYFEEVLFNPNATDNHFNDEYFEMLKEDAISSVKAVKDNPMTYGGIKYAKLMYKGTPGEYSLFPEVEDLENIDSYKLYEYYKTLFDGSYKVDIAILGDVDTSIIDELKPILKQIKGNNKKLRFTIEHKYSNKLIEKVDSLPFNQSRLYIGYRLLNMNFHELNHVLRVYNTILGTMNDSILFNIVREKNSLCYSIGSYYSRYNPSLTIYAGINKKNYEKTVELIKKCVESMSDKKAVERLFDSAKKTINTFINNYYDDLSAQIDTYYNREFETIEDIETLRENVNNVTIDEVINLNNKISLSTIYLLKGDN